MTNVLTNVLTPCQDSHMETNTGLHFHNGEWIALTHSASKTFKTEQGATAWLIRRGYDIDGSRL